MEQNKIGGIIGISASNLVALSISLLTSFILPLYISVEQYGYWQLFTLYSGYLGFFVLGFNDGIHLNYSSCDYNSSIWGKFHTFVKYLIRLTIIETIILISIVYFFCEDVSDNNSLYIITLLNIIPTTIYGFFTYTNQATLRFKQYSIGNMLDKILFAIIMCIMMAYNIKDATSYMVAFTIVRYICLAYIFLSSKEIIFSKPYSIYSLKDEIINNYKKGFPLMISIILGGPTLIVGSRFLIKAEYGIEDFSSYSFSLHTLVIASQFITAVATVFYPIMKRCKEEELPKMYFSFDKITSIFTIILLLSYYLAVITIKILYPHYIDILDYFYFIYPLFIYQCKSSALINNIFKVQNKPNALILINILGIAIHLICVYTLFYIFRNIKSVAVGTLIAMAIWYYTLQIYIYCKSKWQINISLFFDLIICIVFITINSIISFITDNFYDCILYSLLTWSGIIITMYLFNKKRIKHIISEFKYLLSN